jgi:general stress protein 26
MQADDPVVLDILHRSMVARIATLSRNGRPSVNPLYFIYLNGEIWLGTPEWTLAARNVKVDPRVSLLFNVEKDPEDRRILRIGGQGRVRTDKEAMRAYSSPVVRKYILTPGGLYNWLTHPRQLWLRRYYTAQSHEKGRTGVIVVTPEVIELLS